MGAGYCWSSVVRWGTHPHVLASSKGRNKECGCHIFGFDLPYASWTGCRVFGEFIVQ